MKLKEENEKKYDEVFLKYVRDVTGNANYGNSLLITKYFVSFLFKYYKR